MVVCMTVRKLFLKWKLDLALKFHGSARVPLSSLSTLSLSGLCPHPRMPPLCYLFSNTSHGQNAILIFSLQILPNSLNLIFHQTPVTQTPHLLRLPSVVNAATSRGKSSLVIIFPLSYLHAKITLIYLLLSNSAFKAPTLKSKPPCSLAGIPSGIFCLESLLLSCCSLCQSSHSSQKEPFLFSWTCDVPPLLSLYVCALPWMLCFSLCLNTPVLSTGFRPVKFSHGTKYFFFS